MNEINESTKITVYAQDMLLLLLCFDISLICFYFRPSMDAPFCDGFQIGFSSLTLVWWPGWFDFMFDWICAHLFQAENPSAAPLLAITIQHETLAQHVFLETENSGTRSFKRDFCHESPGLWLFQPFPGVLENDFWVLKTTLKTQHCPNRLIMFISSTWIYIFHMVRQEKVVVCFPFLCCHMKNRNSSV